MNKELEGIYLSYLSLEEFLIYIKFTKIRWTRDDFINRYYKNLPNIDVVASRGELETLIYLYSKEIRPTSNAMIWSCQKRNLKVIKYLISIGMVPTSDNIIDASGEGNLDIVKFLYNQKVKCKSDAILIASGKGYLNIIKFLRNCKCPIHPNAINWASTNGHLDVVMYLVSVGIKPTYLTLDEARRNKRDNIIKYLNNFL